MEVKIDDRRLKQLYNIESRFKDMFRKTLPDIPMSLTASEVNAIRNILKPISNRPTLDELVDVYAEGRGWSVIGAPEKTKAGIKAVVREVLRGVSKDWACQNDEGVPCEDIIRQHHNKYEGESDD